MYEELDWCCFCVTRKADAETFNSFKNVHRSLDDCSSICATESRFSHRRHLLRDHVVESLNNRLSSDCRESSESAVQHARQVNDVSRENGLLKPALVLCLEFTWKTPVLAQSILSSALPTVAAMSVFKQCFELMQPPRDDIVTLLYVDRSVAAVASL